MLFGISFSIFCVSADIPWKVSLSRVYVEYSLSNSKKDIQIALLFQGAKNSHYEIIGGNDNMC